MAELKGAPKYEGDADDIAREHGMDALGDMLDDAIVVPPKKSAKFGRHESADTFVSGPGLHFSDAADFEDETESDEPPGDKNSEFMTPEEMGFGSWQAKQEKAKESGSANKVHGETSTYPVNLRLLTAEELEQRILSADTFAELRPLLDEQARRKRLAQLTPIPWGSIEPDLEEEDLIDGLIPSSGLIVVFGPPSSGKSFFVSHLALHVAAGLPYAGRDTKKARVIYIAAEGQKGFKKRVKAAREALGLKLTDDVWFSLITVTPNLGTDSGDVGALIDAIGGEGSPQPSPPPGLIVVDTLSRSLCGADENGPGMATFVENCGKLSESFNGVPVMPVHHTGWSEGRTRGWSGLHGATDAEFSITEKNGVRHVSVGKMKDGEDSLGWTFKLNQVEVGSNPKTGKVKTSCTVELLSDPARVERKEEAGGSGKARVPRSQRVFGDAFNEAMTVHGKLISLTGSGAIGTTVKAVDMERVKDEFGRRWATGEKDEAKREDATRKTFNRVVEKLPSQYPTVVQGGIEYVWRLECKPK